jgi:3D (Asp-Asp-Asp) domain-containing protein
MAILYACTVKKAFTYKFSNGSTASVPQGARLTRNPFEADCWWVDPSVFPAGSLERHDADHYGIRVYADNINALEA